MDNSLIETIKNLKDKEITIVSTPKLDDRIASYVLEYWLTLNGNLCEVIIDNYFSDKNYFSDLTIDIGHKPKFTQYKTIFFNKYDVNKGNNVILCSNSITETISSITGLKLIGNSDLSIDDFDVIDLIHSLDNMSVMGGFLNGNEIIKIINAPISVYNAEFAKQNEIIVNFKTYESIFEPYKKLKYINFNGITIGIYFGTSTYQYLYHVNDNLDSIVAIDVGYNNSCARILATDEETASLTKQYLESHYFIDKYDTLKNSNSGYMLSDVITSSTIFNAL